MSNLSAARFLLIAGAVLVAGRTLAQAPALTGVALEVPALPSAAPLSLHLTFSAPMQAGIASALTVYGAETGRRTGTVTGGGQEWWFTPASPFRAGERLSLTISTAARSAGGQPLAAPYVANVTAPGVAAPLQLRPVPSLNLATSEAHTAVAADIDADGDADLTSDAASFAYMAISRNDGTGQFLGDTIWWPPVYPRRNGLAFADFDGDGDPDLLSNNGGTQVHVYPNNGRGFFGPPQILPLSTFGDNLIAADLNGDAALDIIVGGTPSGEVLVFLNDGAGQFPSAPSYTFSTLPNAHTLDIVDLDADGDLDAVAVSSQQCITVLNEVAAPFSSASAQSLSNAHSDGFRGRVTEDLTGDGVPDLLIPQNSTGGLALLPGNGYGAFATTPQPLVGVDSIGDVGSVADFDGDGDLDLLAMQYYRSSQQQRRWTIFLNDGAGAFTEGFATPLRSSMFQFTAVADFDGDGHLDFTESVSDQEIITYLSSQPAGLATDPAVTALRVVPNPVSQNSPLWIEQLPADASAAQLQDVLGRTVLTVPVPHGESRLQVPTTNLRPGCYFVQLGRQRQRVLVQ